MTVGFRRFRERVDDLLADSALGRALGRGQKPLRVTATVPDPWPGNAKRGGAILRGEFPCGNDLAPLDGDAWTRTDAGPAWRDEVHQFGWLADLAAVGGDEARQCARRIMRDWIARNPARQGHGWRPDLTGARVANWLARHDFVAGAADEERRQEIAASLTEQARHLARTAGKASTPIGRIVAAKGLLYAGLCLEDALAWRDQALDFLLTEIHAQLLPDGGHVSRNPSQHLLMLRHLIDVRAALVAAGADVPAAKQTVVGRLAASVRFFRHGDGGLALFNGANEEEAWLIDQILSRAGARTKAPSAMPETGYQRLAAGRTLILADAGPPPRAGYDQDAHAGTLSFELSSGRHRVIVNCGAYRGGDGSWRGVARTTAAHSTAIVRNTNSSGINPDGGLTRRPANVTCRREEADGAMLLELSHDGYQTGFGLVHRRRLYLSEDGADLRGEDSLAGAGWHDFALRFHLHPSVKASPVHEGQAVLLRVDGGEGWRFAAMGGSVELQPSIYLGVRGRVQRSQQIVVNGSSEAGLGRIKWTLRQVPKA